MLLEKAKGQIAYNQGIRFASRGLWNGSLDTFGFVDSMISVITLGYNTAWNEGAASCGILPSERTDREDEVLQSKIFEATSFLPGYAEFIETNSKANGGFLRTVLERATLWQNRYGEALSQAKVMACDNQKYVWRVGPTDHCSTCLQLNGRVMRANRWRELDIYPQDTRPGKLKCRGFRCQCQLNDTKLPATPGRLPRLS